jgi:DNA-binding beta-propeller fold protein YncE
MRKRMILAVVGLVVFSGCAGSESDAAPDPAGSSVSPSTFDTSAPSVAPSATDPTPGQLVWQTTTFSTLQGGFQLAATADGWVYALESRGHRITMFDPGGYRKSSFGEEGGGPGQFDFFLGKDNYHIVGGIAVSDNFVYIVDESGRIQKFDRDGKYLTAWGRRGDGPGEIEQPQTMVADSRGRLWVGDSKQNTVQGFTTDGKLVARFKVGIKEFLKSMCVDDEGAVYVADEVGAVYKYSSAGKRIATFGTPSNDDGVFKDGELGSALKGMACQTGDLVYVHDQVAGKVHVFDKTGKFVYSFPGADGGIVLGPDNTLIGTDANLGTISKWHLR